MNIKLIEKAPKCPKCKITLDHIGSQYGNKIATDGSTGFYRCPNCNNVYEVTPE